MRLPQLTVGFAVVLVAILSLVSDAPAATTSRYDYDAATAPAAPWAATAPCAGRLPHHISASSAAPSNHVYDGPEQPARTSGREVTYRSAPNTAGGDGDCEPECVQAPIIPNEGAVAHIYSKHYPGGAENFPGEATFYGSEDLYDLLDAAELVTPWEDGENCKRHVDAGRFIGTPIGSSTPTSIYTIITSRPGVLVTAFPGAG